MNTLNYLLLALITLVSINMGDARKEGVNVGPRFAPLEANQGSYVATVYDGSIETTIEEFCFAGYTALAGVRSDTDDSIREFNFANITTIIIDQPTYQSKQFRDKEYTLLSITTRQGNQTIKNLLIDPLITLSGIEQKTRTKYSWYMKNVNKITIHHDNPPIYHKEAPRNHAAQQSSEQTTALENTNQPTKAESNPVALTAASLTTNITSHQPVNQAYSNNTAVDPDRQHSSIAKSFMTLIYAIYDFFMSLFYWIVGLIY